MKDLIKSIEKVVTTDGIHAVGIEVYPDKAVEEQTKNLRECIKALIDIASCDFEDPEDHKQFTDLIEKVTGQKWSEVRDGG